MHMTSTFSTAVSRRTRGMGLAMMCVAVITLLAALPTASAQASSSATPSLALPVAISSVPQEQLEALLGQLPLGELSPAEVGKALAELPGLGLLPAATVEEAVANVVEALAGEGKSLEALLTPGEVVSGLETELKGLLSPIELLGILNGQNLTTLLSSALNSVSSGELVGALLDNAAEPQQLLGEVLSALDAGELEALLGSPLGSTSFVPSTVGAVAGELGMTSEALAEELGLEPFALPSESLGLTGVLPNGTTLGVLDGLEGISLGLFKSVGELTGEGGGAGSGGAGGGAGAGSGTPLGSGSGSASGTTLIVNYPAPAGSAPAANAARAGAKIKILSHRVRHGVATIVVQVPAAGRVVLTGAGLRAAQTQADKAGRLTLHTRLTRAARAKHGKRHARSVRLTAFFRQVGGPSSQANVTVRFAR
jgi:hypothetical protein